MELKIFDLKTKKLSDFLRLFSQLLYSIMVDGKKEFTKNLWFVVRRDMLSYFL